MTDTRSSSDSIELLRGLKYLAGITDDPNALKIAFDRPVTAAHRSALIEAINALGVAQAEPKPVTDEMVEHAWAAIVGSDVAPICFQASIIRADLRTGLEAVLAVSSTSRETVSEASYCALCDLEHPRPLDANGYHHHMIKGQRVSCPVTSPPRGGRGVTDSRAAQESDIVQVRPEAARWGGLLFVVSEVRDWGVVAYMPLPGPCEGIVTVVDTNQAWVRLEWAETT